MKCPWRTIKTQNSYLGSVEYTDFGECYKCECPFYVPERQIASHKFHERCTRTDMEGKNK